MNITIDIDSVLRDTEMNVSILSRSIYDGNGNLLYDKVRIQERDRSLLEDYARSAFDAILNSLGDFVVGFQDMTLTLDDTRRFNEAIMMDLSSLVHQCMVNRVSGEWMKIKAVEYAPVFVGRSEDSMNVIFEKLRFKKEPTLKKYNN